MNINIVPNLYLGGNGLWWECKAPCIVEALGNLVFNIVLGKFFGIKGILLSTIITLISCNFIWRNYILFKKYFDRNPVNFFLESLFYLFITIIVGIITYWICTLSFAKLFFMKMCMCCFVPNILFILLYFKHPYFNLSVKILQNMIKK